METSGAVKGPETEKGAPAASDGLAGFEQRVHLELEFDPKTNAVVIRCKSPTIVLGSILKKAESSEPEEIPHEGDKFRVLVDFDVLTDEAAVRTDAPDMILRGMFFLASLMVTQNQVLQHVQAMVAESRIVRPGGPLS